jgi:putative ABC transport system substrate-binding protein
VFSLGDDPVAMGLVANLNRPNDNITGVTSIGHSLGPKRVEFLREFVPNANVIAFLTNPNQPREFDRKDIEDKASTFGWRLRILGAKSADEFDAVFATIVSEKIGALIVAGDTLFLSESRKLASLALRHKTPAIGALRAFTQDNGLMSYGASIPGVIRQAGAYSGRVLKGEKPADLPVMQPTKFEFVINLRTAKTLGLDVPTALLLRADEVIE